MPVSVVGAKVESSGDAVKVASTKLGFAEQPKNDCCALSPVTCDLSKCTKEQVKEYFTNTYDLDEYIFTGIKEDCDFKKCPDRLRLPLIFYYAHTASVYVNKLMLAGLISERVNKQFEVMFETGVDEMSWDDTENYRMGGSFEWPSVSGILGYRQQVRKVILDVIDSAVFDLPVKMDDPLWSLFMGMEHERIHLETSSVLLRQLPVSMLKRPKNWKYGPHSTGVPVGPNEFVRVPRGKVVIGKPQDFPSYGWDNEYGQAKMDVPEFEATKYLVTNREFLEFVQSDGYQRQEFWTDEGWKWVEFRQAIHPTFWVCDEGCKSGCGADLATYSHCHHSDGTHYSQSSNGTNGTYDSQSSNGTNGTNDSQSCNGTNGTCDFQGSNGTNGTHDSHSSNGTNGTNGAEYMYRTIYDVLPMPWDWPVDVNYHEAKAFCKWKGPEYRVPTESEHHRMRGDPPPSNDSGCDPGFNQDYPANINLKFGSSTPVNMFPPTSMGFYDVYGNVWEWVEDHFNGLPGFKTTYLYDDFSSPCFDGRHTVITGGSWISTGAEASRFSRFAFRRHFFQHLGFRLVRSRESVPARLCQAEVFVLGAGVGENPLTVSGLTEECFHTSTNSQFQYETKQQLTAQLHTEFVKINENGVPMTEFAEKMVAKYSSKESREAAVVLGCGAGITSHLLTKIFARVVGVDYSGRFIDAALALQTGKKVTYGVGQVASLQVLEERVRPDAVTFKQMTWVPNEMEGFNLVLVEFLERLSEPRGWLIKLWECMLPGGLVVVVASDSWDRNTLQSFIGKWFAFLEDVTIGGKLVTVWKLK